MAPPPFGCGTELYGFNVVSSHDVKLLDGAVYGTVFASTGMGYLEAGIRIADIEPHGHVLVKQYFSVGHVRGFLIENSNGPSAVRLERGYAAASDTALLLRNSDGLVIERCVINDSGENNPRTGSCSMRAPTTISCARMTSPDIRATWWTTEPVTAGKRTRS